MGIVRNLLTDSVTVIDDKTTITDAWADTQNHSEFTHAQKFQSLIEKGITLQQVFLTTEECHKLVDLAFKNKDFFATSTHDLVSTNVKMMHIHRYSRCRASHETSLRQNPEMQRAMRS